MYKGTVAQCQQFTMLSIVAAHLDSPQPAHKYSRVGPLQGESFRRTGVKRLACCSGANYIFMCIMSCIVVVHPGQKLHITFEAVHTRSLMPPVLSVTTKGLHFLPTETIPCTWGITCMKYKVIILMITVVPRSFSELTPYIVGQTVVALMLCWSDYYGNHTLLIIMRSIKLSIPIYCWPLWDVSVLVY